jgi:branched-subunit amino acid ABC-type transport system permease component
LWAAILGVPIAAFTVWGLVDNAKLFLTTALNGLTLAALYFLVASGFTLVFGLMRNVNLAHGSLYLLGGYLGFFGGALLYLAAAEILPEAHHEHPARSTLLCTVAGVGFIWLVVGLAG